MSVCDFSVTGTLQCFDSVSNVIKSRSNSFRPNLDCSNLTNVHVRLNTGWLVQLDWYVNTVYLKLILTIKRLHTFIAGLRPRHIGIFLTHAHKTLLTNHECDRQSVSRIFNYSPPCRPTIDLPQSKQLR